jgi:DNA invertase Pin-like site-specific DNA recombinase
MGKRIAYAMIAAAKRDDEFSETLKRETNADMAFVDWGFDKCAERRGFRNMMKAAESGDAIVVSGIEKLALSVGEFAAIAKEFKRRNIRFVCVKGGIDTGKEAGVDPVDFLETLVEAEQAWRIQKFGESAGRARTKGRPKVYIEEIDKIYNLWKNEDLSLSIAAKNLGTARSTIYTKLKEYEKTGMSGTAERRNGGTTNGIERHERKRHGMSDERRQGKGGFKMSYANNGIHICNANGFAVTLHENNWFVFWDSMDRRMFAMRIPYRRLDQADVNNVIYDVSREAARFCFGDKGFDIGKTIMPKTMGIRQSQHGYDIFVRFSHGRTAIAAEFFMGCGPAAYYVAAEAARLYEKNLKPRKKQA